MKKIISRVLLIIMLILVTVLIIVFVLKHNKNKSLQYDENLPRDGMIELYNLENAKVKNGVKYNTSSKIKEVHTYKNFVISNMKLYSEEGQSIIEFNVENKVDKDIDKRELTFKFYRNKEHDIMYAIGYDVKKEDLEKGKIRIEYIEDVINAYDYEVISTTW